MKTTKILMFLIGVIILSACAPAVATPTRDPMVVAQSTALAAIQTQMVSQPAVVTQPTATTSVSAVVEQPEVSQPVQPAGVSVACITEAEFEALVGVRADIDRTEPCSFHWRGDPATITPVKICPEGWSCTLGVETTLNKVFVGDDNLPSQAIFSGTWRKVDQYKADDAVHNPCEFLAKVQHEGAISDPVWTAEAGNFSCE